MLLAVTLWAAALQVVTTSTTCGKPTLRTRIFGGNLVVPGEFPWHATLTYKGKPYCGGSLVSDRWIVTAAHCFDEAPTEDKRNPTLWHVHLGFTKLGYFPVESSMVTMTPSRIVIHESYTQYINGFDIALVELPTPVTFSHFISPLCLPENSHRFHLRRTCYATGLESVPDGVPLDSKRYLQKVGQILIGWKTCNCIYNTHLRPDLSNPANSSMMCITESDGKKGPCQGDSGGAVVCEEDGVWFLAGVISFSQGCYLMNSPTILTSASSFQDWIKRWTNNQASFSRQTIEEVDDVDNDYCKDLLSNHTKGCGVSVVSDLTSGIPGTWPWHVDLRREGKRACSGALISSSWVITAAECFIGHDSSELPEDWTVTVGSGTPVVKDIAVQKISIHGSYVNPQMGSNVALVKLAQTVPLGQYRQAICLPDSSHQISYGSVCWHITGNYTFHGDEMGVPQGEQVEVLGPNECNCIYSRPNTNNRAESVMEGMICASSKGENSSQCLNDLGGALVCNDNGTWFLRGVYNYGGECEEATDCTRPRVFTQVNTYEEWLKKETREMFYQPLVRSPAPKPDTERCSLDSPRGCGLSAESPGPEVIGEATDKMWPWQVSLQQFDFHACSGVLISETWILTAAHCIPSYTSKSDFTVVLGRKLQNEPSPREVLRQIKTVVPHPEYNEKTGENDAALVELNFGVTFSDYILPVCLALNQSSPSNNECWVVGWGRFHPLDKGVSLPPLRHLRVHVLDGKNCEAVENMTETGGTGQACVAAKNTVFSCLLDSSAPLVCQPNPKGPWFLFGIGSKSSPSKRKVCPSNFTSVVPMLSWIREVVPKQDLTFLERNAIAATYGYNNMLTFSMASTATTEHLNATMVPESANTTYKDDDVPITDVHHFTTSSTQSSGLEPNGSWINASGHIMVTPQVWNLTLSSSITTQQTTISTSSSSTSTQQTTTSTLSSSTSTPKTISSTSYSSTSTQKTTTSTSSSSITTPKTTTSTLSSSTTTQQTTTSTSSSSTSTQQTTTSSSSSSTSTPKTTTSTLSSTTTQPTTSSTFYFSTRTQTTSSTLSSSTTQQTTSSGNAEGETLWRTWTFHVLLGVLFHNC